MKNKNIAKKAQEGPSYIMLVIAILIVLLLILGGLFISHIIRVGLKYQIKEDMTKLSNDLLLLDILRAPIRDKTMADIVVSGYTKNNYDEVETEMDNLLITYIGEKTDWELFIDNQKKRGSCGILGCKGKKNTYTALLPLINTKEKANIKVTLRVYFAK